MSDFPEQLVQQLTHLVRWASTLQTILDAGVRTFVLMGCQCTLRALLRKNTPSALQRSLTMINAEHPDEMEQARCALNIPMESMK